MDDLSRSRWSRGVRRKSAVADLLGWRVRIPQVAWILSLVNIVTCPVEVSATGWLLVQRSPTDCVFVYVRHWVWSRAKISIYASSVKVENVRLGRIVSLDTSFISVLYIYLGMCDKNKPHDLISLPGNGSCLEQCICAVTYRPTSTYWYNPYS